MKYPNGYFRVKPCRCCGEDFQPTSPSHLYCSPACARKGRQHAYLKREYGIGHHAYAKRKRIQGAACAICGREGFKMKAAHHTKLAVDHDHDTGKVRGLLCHNCNRGLGLFQDSPDVLLRAVDYLGKHGKGVTTIPEGSTPQANGGGSAKPHTEDVGEEIVWTRRKRRAARKGGAGNCEPA